MREILFRGKTVRNYTKVFLDEWVYGDLVKYSNKVNGKTCIKVDYEEYEVDPETVGQFTGLLDKNGVEIYEGDILSFDGNITADDSLGIEPNGYVYDEDSIHLVVWDNEIGGWSLAFEKNAEWKYKHHTHGLMTGGIAIVIGNIYDNPELLKVNQ